MCTAEQSDAPQADDSALPTIDQQQEFLLRAKDARNSARYLAESLGLTNFDTDTRESVRVDVTAVTLRFASTLTPFPAKVASVCSLGQKLLSLLSASESYKAVAQALKDHLVAQTSASPDPSDGKLAPEQIKQVGRFFADLLLRNYNLYSCVFTKEREWASFSADLVVEEPRIPLHLDPPEPAAADVPSQPGVRTEEEYQAALEAARVKAEQEREEALEAEREAASAAERQRRRLETEHTEAELEELRAKRPATLEEAIELQVKVKVAEERVRLCKEFEQKEAELLEQIGTLKAKVAG